jgi:hypothetical protein
MVDTRTLARIAASVTVVSMASSIGHAAPPVRSETSAMFGAMVHVDSDYSRSLPTFDHAPLGLGFVSAGQHLFGFGRHLRFGPRLGYRYVGSSLEPTGVGPAVGAAGVGHHLFDGGVALRWVFGEAHEQAVRFDLELAAGAAVVHRSWQGVTDTSASPSMHVSLGMALGPGRSRTFLGARLGFTYTPSSLAMNGGGDPVFSGATITVELGRTR